MRYGVRYSLECQVLAIPLRNPRTIVAMSLVRSRVALELLLALRHQQGRSLTQLAHALEVSLSSVQRALAILIEDGVVIAEGDRRSRRYRLSEAPAVPHLIGLAITSLPLDRVLRITARSHPAIEFMARRDSELTVVFSEREGTLAASDAARALVEIAEQARLTIRYFYHDDLRRELLVRPELRQRAASATILHGSLERSFPDRRHHGMSQGESLGRAHSSLRLPSRRRLQRLAKQHQLDALSLFGSATRSDFRPDSDVDVAISFRPGVPPALQALAEIEHELERATGRDVELVQIKNLEPEVRASVEKEAVRLLP